MNPGILVVIFGLLYMSVIYEFIQLCGVVYIWGDANIYAISYLRLHYEPNVLLSDVFIALPLQSLIGGLLMPFSSTIAYSLTPRG